MKTILVFLFMACSVAIHAKKFPVTYTMTLSPNCIATFDGWIDVNVNPLSSSFGDVTAYGGTVTITGTGCNPGTYPVSGIVSGGTIPSSEINGEELTPLGYETLIRIHQSDRSFRKILEDILNN